MAFVRGHARETGWVISHYRRPQRSGDGQLPLPAPRPAPDHDGPEEGARPEDAGDEVPDRGPGD